jgi:hypothetical protein
MPTTKVPPPPPAVVVALAVVVAVVVVAVAVLAPVPEASFAAHPARDDARSIAAIATHNILFMIITIQQSSFLSKHVFIFDAVIVYHISFENATNMLGAGAMWL